MAVDGKIEIEARIPPIPLMMRLLFFTFAPIT